LQALLALLLLPLQVSQALHLLLLLLLLQVGASWQPCERSREGQEQPTAHEQQLLLQSSRAWPLRQQP
jgi:hypothetical protein